MIEYLFSYGTLQERDVQFELFGRHLNGSKDVLRSFKASLIELRDEDFVSHSERRKYYIATLSDNENDAIEGMALEVSEEELSVTDNYEPEEYKRERVTLESGKQAWIYVAA